MFLSEFPNLRWLRAQAASNFLDRQDSNGHLLNGAGWPSVVLNVVSGHTERDDIKGPFSIFLNIEGQSMVRANNRWHQVTTDFYCFSNKNDLYDLHIPKGQQTQTFNIHFGEKLFSNVVSFMREKPNTLLEFGTHQVPTNMELLPKLYWKSPELSKKIFRIKQLISSSTAYEEELEYQLLSDLLVDILLQCDKKLQPLAKIHSVKKSTRKELFQRVNMAEDYLKENAFGSFSLDALSKHCGLSKFHLLRLFKDVNGLTPFEYVATLRLQKAKLLLAKKKNSIQEIAWALGFSELPAFTRFFKRNTHFTPQHFRSQISNLG